MGSLTSSLIISLIDRVSGPAKGVGAALKGVAAAEKKLGSGGTSKKFDGLAGSLERAQKAAKGLEFVDLRKTFSSFNLTSREIRAITKDFDALQRAVRGMKASDQLGALRIWRDATVRDLRAVRHETHRLQAVRERAASTFRRSVRNGVGYMTGGSLTYGAYRAGRAGVEATAGNVREGARDYLAGLSPTESARLKATALGLSGRYPSVSMESMHQSLRETATSMRSVDKAVEMGDTLARGLVVLQSLKGKDEALKESAKFFSALDTLGKNLDPGEVRELFHGYLKALGVEGVDLNMADLKLIAQKSKSAGPGLSNRFLMATAPGLQGDMGAARLGTALGSEVAQIIGDRATKKAKAAQSRYGLRNGRGWIDSRKIMTDPDKFAWENLIPALKKKGIDPDDVPAVTKVMNEIFSNQMVSDLFTKMITQRQQYQGKSEQYEKAPGLDAAQALRGKDPFVALQGLTSSLLNFVSVAGEGGMKSAVSGLNSLADAIGNLTQKLADNPKLATGAALGTGAAAVGGGIGTALGLRGLYRWFTKPAAGGAGAAAAGSGALGAAAKFGLKRVLGPIGLAWGLYELVNGFTGDNSRGGGDASSRAASASRAKAAYSSGMNPWMTGETLPTGKGSDIWGGGAKPVDFLDGSVKAAGAGQKTGEAFKSALEAELSRVDATIAAAVQRWTGMLGFSVSPTITPNISNPPAQRQGGLSGSKHAMHADYGFGTTG
ncbi:hypothetical protein OCAR_5595 [Afipia carboxidovorans OM5]|uniref:Phage tail tape measure protein domain-containing protein n=1 Tax=Afipia carboxidovorans (strain ATCC 49405 / DSM 1227 / KCTC 32145 / OM5) TaxID=504832 RepID=B6JEG1_AFIC5|nr:hypothetical protein [Afipia carboxidovorans]ACI92726.1 hypothetical protein OCAR_5595 [Afipia carboxidovorans OM5]AEI03522.1 hypothetical protein OCA4_c24020 [Afipia carboxidovorans OM4]AEI07099.1 hypothetical protein OCA5_c24030 [Afipia carboxidovorans OM5]